ncbi:hect E3 ubiquitin ligase [Reticulomyxa filosa]|uniref:Hect E3 ubiquitin ligase n=1 Tax=Reticulomyxa filosa TaxID=46433 RepID=X6NYB1_RETFI|nr:hect E3 ubiquitin ligase [Reticulomyxa filosa]|eukprot:ETO30853.1 hect E3 ubiquitin ligase [Reticulomyxa filosa]
MAQDTAVTSPSSTVLLTFGKNAVGQTGHPELSDKTDNLRALSEFGNEELTFIAAGFDHSGAICGVNGECFVWGDNGYGQSGSKDDKSTLEPNKKTQEPLYTLPHKIRELSRIPIAQIALGGQHSLCLAKSGQVYAFGNNKNGQCGISPTLHSILQQPVLLKFAGSAKPPLITSVYAGYQHSACIDNEHQLYMCGDNSRGQCGVGHITKAPKICPFTKVSIHVHKVALGRWHTLLLTSDTRYVYSCGWSRFGVLGCNDDSKDLFQFHAVHMPTNVNPNSNSNRGTPVQIADIHSGAVHCAAITADRKSVYMWGRGQFGRLGLGDFRNALVPTKLQVFFRLTLFLYVAKKKKQIPWQQQNDSVHQLGLGGDYCVLLTTKGDIFVWGKNEEGYTYYFFFLRIFSIY